MIIISLILMGVLTAIDQLINMQVTVHLKPIEKIEVIPGLLQLRYIENTGVSFGLFEGNSMLFAASSLILSIIIIIVFVRHKDHNFFSYFAGICIVAGGLGNFLDRVFFGYVMDYIEVMFFPYIFNFADCMVVLGTISFVIYILFYYDKKKITDDDKDSENKTISEKSEVKE